MQSHGIGTEQQLLSIRIGADPNSAADYHLLDQQAIDALLRSLLELRGEAVVP